MISLDSVTFIFIRRNGLFICVTTHYNVCPNTIIELLHRMTKVFKDYIGVLSEEAIRKNFILIYELLEEMIDFGYPQVTSTEMLKSCVHNDPILVSSSNNRNSGSSIGGTSSGGSNSAAAMTIDSIISTIGSGIGSWSDSLSGIGLGGAVNKTKVK